MVSSTLSKTITDFSGRVRILAANTLKELGRSAYYILLEKSPVKLGRYRSSHRISLNTIDQSFALRRNRRYGPAFGEGPNATEMRRAASGLRGITATDVIILSDSVPYAGRIEFEAHSSMAPDGVYAPMEAILQSKINEIVAKVRFTK